MLKIAGVESSSIVDGPGFRYTVFFQGCPHRCDGCHNPQTWEENSGMERDIASLVQDIKKKTYIDGVTISGGEPFFQPAGLLQLVQALKNLNYNIIVFSGYTFEEITSRNEMKACLPYIDVLVDGKYDKSQRTLTLRFRGSQNQRVIDVPKSLETETPVLMSWDV